MDGDVFGYQGQRVVVTGGASGMGEATARLAGELGAEVVICDIKKPTVAHTQFLELDLRDRSAVDAAVAEIVRGGGLHKLFYCAGLPGPPFSTVDVMTVNFIAQRHMIRALVPHMESGDAICSISSGAGLGYLANMARVFELLAIEDFDAARGWVATNMPEGDAYSFSKECSIVFALHHGCKITSETGVRVNVISPGPTDTPMMPSFVANVGADFFEKYPKPIGRNSTPEEQAWPMVFLNSRLASYVSGENLFTDGGACGGMVTGAIDISELVAGMQGG